MNTDYRGYIGLVDLDVEPSLLVHRAYVHVVKGLIPSHDHRHRHHLLLTTESYALISAVVAELSFGHLESVGIGRIQSRLI